MCNTWHLSTFTDSCHRQTVATATVYWQAYQKSLWSTAVSSKCVSQAAMWLSKIWPRHATDTWSTPLAPHFTSHWVQTVFADVQITSWHGTSIPLWSLLFDIRGGNWSPYSVCDKRWPSCSSHVHRVWCWGIFCHRSTCMEQAPNWHPFLWLRRVFQTKT